MPTNGLGSALAQQRRAQLAAAQLYLVCDARPGGRDLISTLEAALAGGVQIVQLRDKLLGDRELTELADAARRLCAEHQALLLVNDRPHVARAAAADGVHLGQQDMDLPTARSIVGPDALIGLSTHNPQQIDAAELAHGASAGPDYIGVGPIFATPTKPDRRPVGPELLSHARAHCTLPFFAIGGIDVGNASGLLSRGARRVAVVRAIAEAGDPAEAARALRAVLAPAAAERPKPAVAQPARVPVNASA